MDATYRHAKLGLTIEIKGIADEAEEVPLKVEREDGGTVEFQRISRYGQRRAEYCQNNGKQHHIFAHSTLRDEPRPPTCRYHLHQVCLEPDGTDKHGLA